MRDLILRLKSAMTTKASLTAATIVLVGGGAAIAAPGVDLSADDDLERIAAPTEDDGAVDEYCDDENPDASFCSGPSEPADSDPGEVVDEYCEEDADASFCSGPSEPEEDPDAGEDGDEGDDGDDAQAFSAWVRSLPKDWGCIRGQLVSHAARQGPTGDAFEELTFETATEAAEALRLEGRCVEVAIAKADGGSAEGDDDTEFGAQATGDDGTDRSTARPEHAGPKAKFQDRPDHAGPKAKSEARSNDAGPPKHAKGRGRG